ncbi:MAG: DUF502 domain-containing protein [Paracoccaceae bacterium]
MTDKPKEKAKPWQRRSLLSRVRANFLTGLVVLVPIALTLYLFWSFVGWIDSWVLPFVPNAYQPDALIRYYFGEESSISIRGVGVVVFFLFTIFVGWIAKGFLGRSFLGWAEGLVNRMPVVRSVYSGLKQIAETVFSQKENSFEKACLVEYPRKGIWAIAFISTTAKGEINAGIPRDEQMISVFLPSTPNPTSGFLLFVPSSDIIELKMSVEDAAKLVISAGLVYPNGQDPTVPIDIIQAK